MRREEVRFYSRGEAVAGTFLAPGPDPAPGPVVLQGPGWLGLRDGASYRRYHDALVAAGYRVFVFDYRGFGDSAGDRTTLSPVGQLDDLRSAVAYLTTREDVDPARIGVFGSGGTGGGNPFLLAAVEPSVRAIVSQMPVADGRDWLHRMRSEHEWLAFLAELDEDRRVRAVTGESRLVDPREQIMVATPERRTTGVKRDVDSRVTREVRLSSADEILTYRPIDAASGLTVPSLIVAVAGDATTPTDHAEQLFDVLAGPRRLVVQHGTTHYGAYETYGDRIADLIVAWFDEHLVAPDAVVVTSAG